jgi:hypothetical protein
MDLSTPFVSVILRPQFNDLALAFVRRVVASPHRIDVSGRRLGRRFQNVPSVQRVQNVRPAREL